MITHEIDLNVGQPNNKQFIHINQGEYDSVQIMAHIWNKNKPYTIDADKIRIEGKLSSGALLFDGDSAIQIVKENDTTVSFILTKPIAASVGSFNFSLLFYKGSDVLKKTFPFTIRVSGNPANNVKSDAVLDGVIKKLEQQEQEYNQLATVAKTGDYNDLINKPSGLTVTTNLFKPIPFINIHGKKCVILVNSDNTMTVKNDSTDSQTFKIGTAHVTKGTVYKFICYSSDYENLKNTSVQINGTDYSGLDHYEYTADVSGDIDISICTNANNMGTYTIYPMLTLNLAATTDDYVPHTGIYDEINWDVSELNRGIFRYPTLKLYDNDKCGGITYDGTDNTLSVSCVNNKYPKFILSDLTAGKTEVSNLTVGNWLPIGKSDIVLKRYDMNDEGETYITDTISLYDFYTSTSKKFQEIDHSIENLYGETEFYVHKAGDSMTGALRIYVDKIKGSAAIGDDPIVFAITPEQNTSLFTVTTKTMTRNGSTVFSNYQSSANTTHINTSNIKFWNTEFIRSESTESLNLTLPKTSGTIALISDIPKAGDGTITIDQFGQQTDSFTLNQNADVTISLIHDDTKLDVAGGEMSGDLYVAGTLGLGNAFKYTYIDYNDNEVSFNKVNNSSSKVKVLGVCGDYFKTANVSVGDDVMLKEYGEMNDEGERPIKRTISLSDLCNRIEKIEAALENLGYMDSNIVSQAISMALDENN